MISLLFLCIASLCNAIMDVSMFRFDKSILKTDNQKWDEWWSDRRKRLYWGKHFLQQLNDAWHFFKMWMIVFFILAIIFYKPMFAFYVDFWIYGIAWNLIFNLFFDHILIKER